MPVSPEDAALLHHAATVLATARPDGAAPFAIAVAVSGGGDSVALLHLLHRLGRIAVHEITADPARWPSTVHQITADPAIWPPTVHAVTVDHGLRPESAAEAAQVAALCARLGIAHDILRWQGPAPTGNLMDQARKARLSLIANWARGKGMSHVFLGHTADDDAESFLMNLARAAGLEGLSGMRAGWQEHGLNWHRPLLNTSRAALRAYLRRNGVAWLDDPSNDNDRFARVRARNTLKALKPLGIMPDQLRVTMRNLASAQGALRQIAHAAALRMDGAAGQLHLPRADWLALPEDIRRRLLIAAIRWMGGGGYPPRGDKISRFVSSAWQGGAATLGGVRLHATQAGLTLTREARACMGAVPFGQIWDHRWHLSGPGTPPLTIAPLGEAGLAQCPDWRNHAPREALVVSPAIWHDTRLIAAPLARKETDWAATLQPSFGMFILRH